MCRAFAEAEHGVSSRRAKRAVSLVASFIVTLYAAQSNAQPATKKPAQLPAMPLSIAVAEQHGKPVVKCPWLRRQVAEAERLLSAQRVHVKVVKRRRLPARYVALEKAKDRDALVKHLERKVINVFVVRTLRDVHDPRYLIQGVRWRNLRNLRKDYIIVAASASPTTLAHELGHYFGNPHSYVDNNIMSYKRSDPSKVRFNAKQGAKMRRAVAGYLRSKKLKTAAQILAAAKAAKAAKQKKKRPRKNKKAP